ncbi:hypothetical protein AQUCO_07800001v1 [Aquilegia coerulea]|uniref:Uncharacterized protein n=1 Tax=Aquilegia coerulea TaxID=218851 RepID=A0A2G5C7Y8_AQUCA|nr:hypothetical protein AQUCO_07800001v1 [Aquilegia coerulea]PIA27367.1 hypothetical protein AQUCO_07800001v1 [Aquilegia coerulea]
MFTERGSDETSSNLRNFLDGITPVVPSRYLPRKCIKHFNGLWNPWERETVEYFHLADLWSSYDEWSAYGVGTRIKLDVEETVVQYYVPYLSAIQIFTSNRPTVSYREEDDYDDCSSEDSTSDQESQWHPNNRLGRLYFQYFERSSPYQRVPLVDKINGFTEQFPGLMTLKSIDLSPASWMSVAWYPIYHIPTGRTIKDLSASFLTYHTLSSSFLDMAFEEEMGIAERKGKKGNGIVLPPFGLATYKMHGDVWLSDQTGRDREKLVSLLSAADSWLKQLRVQQHDFNYFTTKRYR